MSTWETILDEHERRIAPAEKSTVTVGGESVDLDDPQTTQRVEGSILGANVHGIPRGKEAYQARQLGETWAMEIVKNAINDQLLGGDLGQRTPDDEEPSGAAQDLWALLRDVLEGPHLQDHDWGDLVSAAVSDMVDIGHGYWEPIPSADGCRLNTPPYRRSPSCTQTCSASALRSGCFGRATARSGARP